MNILCDHVLSIQTKLTHVQPLDMMTESVEKFLVSICNISMPCIKLRQKDTSKILHALKVVVGKHNFFQQKILMIKRLLLLHLLLV